MPGPGCPAPSDPPPRLWQPDFEMWEDYRAFKAAGMLRAWREKYKAVLEY